MLKDLNCVDTSHETPLLAAAKSGNIEIVEMLAAEPRVWLMAQTKDGETAFDRCSNSRIKEILRDEISRRWGGNWERMLDKVSEWTVVEEAMIHPEVDLSKVLAKWNEVQKLIAFFEKKGYSGWIEVTDEDWNNAEERFGELFRQKVLGYVFLPDTQSQYNRAWI